jgi:hypothetical protein
MKSFPLMLIAASVMVICVFSSGLVFALEPSEALVTPTWSTQTIYQGNTVSLSILFQSNSSYELDVYSIGIHFDWMPSGSFYGHNLSDNPVKIVSYGFNAFAAILLNIPSNVSVGEHSYFIGIDGLQNSAEFSWNSPSFDITILDSQGKIFTALEPTVQAELNEAISATYKSTEAKSLLQQAKDAYEQANVYANDGNYQEAVTSLENATAYLHQAKEAEQLNDEQNAQQQTLLLIVAVVAVVVVVVGSLVAVVVRRKRKTDNAAETVVDESTEN